MAGSSVFPKEDGDVWFDKDANKAGFQFFISFEQESLQVISGTSNDAAYSAARDSHIIKNIGSATAFVNFDGTAATTSDWRLQPSEVLTIDTNTGSISAISDGGSTVLRIIGQS